MGKINFLLLTIISLFLLVSVNAATVSHPASEITAGTFGAGHFTIKGLLNIDTVNSYSAIDFYDNGVNKWGIGKNPSNKFYIDLAGVGNALTIDTNRRVGIQTTSPDFPLDVAGDVRWTGTLQGGSVPWGRLTSIPATATRWSSWSEISGIPAGFADGADNVGAGVPSGFVGFFNLGSCPSGWSEVTGAKGRYLVGGGSTGATVGTALSNQENRAVGQHSHSVSDPGHYHLTRRECHGFNCPGGAPKSQHGGVTDERTTSSGTGLSISSSGSVGGTNAPYIQFLVCQKN